MSLLKCLCFPNKKAKGEQRRKWQNMTHQPVSAAKSSSRSKLLHYNDREYLDQEVIASHVETDTWTRLESQPGVKKRRGLDEIFDRPKSEILKSSDDPLNFRNVGYPCMVSGHLESMYGYTPRAVQDVYASSALEGGAIEDYFTECHNENMLRKFASAESCHGHLDSNMNIHTVESRIECTINSDGDYSSDSDMDVLDYCGDLFPETDFQTNPSINPNSIFTSDPFYQNNSTTPYMCRSEDLGFKNQHFDEIFGNDGEVLY